MYLARLEHCSNLSTYSQAWLGPGWKSGLALQPIITHGLKFNGLPAQSPAADASPLGRAGSLRTESRQDSTELHVRIGFGRVQGSGKPIKRCRCVCLSKNKAMACGRAMLTYVRIRMLVLFELGLALLDESADLPNIRLHPRHPSDEPITH